MRVLVCEQSARRGPRAMREAAAGSVLVCVERPLVRRNLRELLAGRPDFAVEDVTVGSFEDLIVRYGPAAAAVVLDRLPSKPVPGAKLCFLAAGDSWRTSILSAINHGALGVVGWQSLEAELAAAIRTVAAGQGFLSAAFTQQVFDWLSLRLPEHIGRSSCCIDKLSDREREVLAILGQGHPNSVISRRLGISATTVRSHISHISSKLDMATRGELALLGYQLSIFDGARPDRDVG
jgi:DNA-binding NarL/FixJ family response regulator